MKLAGIYRIKNLINGKVYIGSAVNVKVRLGSHKRNLIRNTHCNAKLQNAYNKYGAKNFKFKVIKKLNNDISAQELIAWEQHYMDKYQSYVRGIGYNICPIAGTTLGKRRKKSSTRKMVATLKAQNRHLTQEQKDHLSKIFTGKKISQERKDKIKKNWRQAADPEYKAKKISLGKLKGRENKGKTYQAINPQGELITIQNLRKFCEDNNLQTNGFLRLFRGKRKSYRKFKKVTKCN